ncbi:MAG TPA: hypothetical protein VGL00_13330 [Terracidiphilus sp.]
MANHTGDTQQDSKNIPNQAPRQGGGRSDDIADAATIERLEAIAGGADEDDPRLFLDPSLSGEADKLDAETEEELDALRVNLVQDGGESHTTDTSGRIVDETAEEEIARFTEVGPMQPDQGVVSVEPGRDDTSRVLRRHHPNTTIARAQDVVEGNLDEPMDEQVTDRKVDEGTAA